MYGGALVIEPETAIPESLRRKLFACEKEAVDALRGLIETRDLLRAIIAAMEDADQFGARYAIFPNAELAIYTVRAPLPPNLWHELHGFRLELAGANGNTWRRWPRRAGGHGAPDRRV
jgi:hypothetical protein